jgi:hypothetical protein
MITDTPINATDASFESAVVQASVALMGVSVIISIPPPWVRPRVFLDGILPPSTGFLNAPIRARVDLTSAKNDV